MGLYLYLSIPSLGPYSFFARFVCLFLLAVSSRLVSYTSVSFSVSLYLCVYLSTFMSISLSALYRSVFRVLLLSFLSYFFVSRALSPLVLYPFIFFQSLSPFFLLFVGSLREQIAPLHCDSVLLHIKAYTFNAPGGTAANTIFLFYIDLTFIYLF